MSIKQSAPFLCVLSLLAAGVLPDAWALQEGDSVVYNFQGKFMVTSPCTVSNDKVMDIPFGNIGVNKVDGINFMQTIPYTVDCQGAPDSSPLNLTVSATPVSFDDAAITTSAPGLGIQIQANDQPMKLNQPLVTTLGAVASLALKAVPVKDPAKELTGQAFTATATLTAEYQ